MNIAIFGCGYVGLVTGACFAKLGHRVICIDNNQEKITQLQQGVSPIYEPGLSELIQAHLALDTLTFTTNAALAIHESQLLFIAVGTPSYDDGSVDLRFVFNCATTIAETMNDYKVVQNFYSDRHLYHKLTPDVTYKTHKDTVAYFQKVLAEKRDRPIVVITHMAPSFMSVNEKYKNDTTNNGGYASDLSDIILDNSNIKVWVHGHMHDPVDYMIGDTRVLANPRGYIPWEAGNGFDINCTFDI